MYDPQYNQEDYWQAQAQQWKAMQQVSSANGDTSTVASTATTAASAVGNPPLPIPPHLQNHHSMGSTPPPASSTTSSKQLTPHQTPPSLSRTDSPLLEKEARSNKVGELQDERSDKDKSVEKDESNAAKSLDHSVDLDARLKMLMKDKSSAVPAFLLDCLQSEEEEEEVEQEVESTAANNLNQNSYSPSSCPIEELKPLSRAPSPFLSRDHYLNCHEEQVKVEQARHDNEMSQQSSSQKRHQGGRSRGRRGGARPDSRNSDAMSLSSLSSGENNILEDGPMLEGHSQLYPPQYYGYPPHHPSYPPGGLNPSDASHGYYQSSATTHASYPMYPAPGHPYDAANMPPHLMGRSQYHPGMPQPGNYGTHGYGNWGGNGGMGAGYPNDDPMLIFQQGGKSDKKSIRPLVR